MRNILILVAVATLVSACNNNASGGSAVARASLLLPPDLPDTIGLLDFVEGLAIEPLVLTNKGGSISSCTAERILPTGTAEQGLPMGLALGEKTCMISGTPEVSDPRLMSYTLKASNNFGSDTLIVRMRINRALNIVALGQLPIPLSSEAPFIALSSTSRDVATLIPVTMMEDDMEKYLFSFRLGVPTSQALSGSEGIILFQNYTLANPIAQCLISPGLPNGLELLTNPNYCVIQGVPIAIVTQEKYTVTATGATGDRTSVEFYIRAIDRAPVPALASAGDVRLLINSGQALPIAFTNLGSPPTSCSGPQQDGVSTLPAGLAVGVTEDGLSCQIMFAEGSRGPTVLVERASYAIVANNINGRSRASLYLAVVDTNFANSATAPKFQLPASLTPSSTIQFEVGQATHLPLVLVNSGGSPSSCSISRADGGAGLPSGLEIELWPTAGNNSTCRITGVPSVATPQKEITILSANALAATFSRSPCRLWQRRRQRQRQRQRQRHNCQ